ncbi:MAG: hypothetical protein IT249_02780 [Chitinophagaceae bacterium]|nr:hypothetical protein [Chitinophagaceae bacterium]
MDYLMVGAFPGYIWGWFQLPDTKNVLDVQKIATVYSYSLLGALVTLSVYAIIKTVWPKHKQRLLVRLFAALAVSSYYWFRLPQLIGLSNLDTNGVLINLSNELPLWTKYILNLISTSFFFWWFILLQPSKKSWSVRPAFSQ